MGQWQRLDQPPRRPPPEQPPEPGEVDVDPSLQQPPSPAQGGPPRPDPVDGVVFLARIALRLMGYAVVAFFGLVTLAALIAPRQGGRSQAREKGCYANIRVIQSAIEQYNMDHAAMLNDVRLDLLTSGLYLKTTPVCPDAPDANQYEGFNLVGDGVVHCRVHGGVE